MKTRNRKGGYLANTANEYIDSKQAIHCLSVELEPQIRFEEGQPTGGRLSLIRLGSLKKGFRLLW